MDQQPPKVPATVVTIEECLAIIPASVARHPEARDYVDFFCGLECGVQVEKRNNTLSSISTSPFPPR